LIEVVYEIDERKIKVKVPRFDMTKHPGVEADGRQLEVPSNDN
jgi:hypothetical protein